MKLYGIVVKDTDFENDYYLNIFSKRHSVKNIKEWGSSKLLNKVSTKIQDSYVDTMYVLPNCSSGKEILNKLPIGKVFPITLGK